MAREREIEAWLAELAEDEAPVPPALHAAVLDGLPEARPRRAWWWSGLFWAPPAAAALCGLWLGVAQPALVLDAVPGMSAAYETEDAFDDWEGWL